MATTNLLTEVAGGSLFSSRNNFEVRPQSSRHAPVCCSIACVLFKSQSPGLLQNSQLQQTHSHPNDGSATAATHKMGVSNRCCLSRRCATRSVMLHLMQCKHGHASVAGSTTPTGAVFGGRRLRVYSLR